MKMYSMSSASPVRIRFAAEAAAAVRQFPETQPLADVILQQNGELQKRYDAVVAAENAMVEKRVALRFAGWTLDQSIRLFHNGAVMLDGGKPGKLTEALFPAGLTVEVTPSGESQIAATDKLSARAKACRTPGAEKLVAERLAAIESGLENYRTALEVRNEGTRALYAARAAEDAAQNDHALAMDKVMGAIRTAFPRDRARWDVIIPREPGKKRDDGRADADASEPE